MAQGIEVLAKAWEEREGPTVLITVDPAKKPNAIYVSDIRYDKQTGFVVADNYFDKTRANIKAESRGAILFITKAGKSYQAKGSLAYHTQGSIFDDMKAWHIQKHPGVAATVLEVEELYSGAERLV